MLTKQSSIPAFVKFLIVAVLALQVFPNPAYSQWSGQADSPLLFGEMEIFAGGLQHSTATTPDGATWITWIDSYCLGSFMIQRIGPNGTLLRPGGMLVAADDTCGFTEPPHIAACSDNSVVVTRGASITTVYRISPSGEMVWGAQGIEFNDGAITGGFGGMIGQSNGEVLFAWHSGSTMLAQKFSADGAPVWHRVATIETVTGSNRRIFSVVPDGSGGAIVFWDSPHSYEQLVFAIRFDNTGNSAWQKPLLLVPFGIGSSLHTDPFAISDGKGGAYLSYTEGLEQIDIPSRLFLHHIDANGSSSFAEPGIRVSEKLSRQYDAKIRIDEQTGDAMIFWRDGGFAAQDLYAQRISRSGMRLWGDEGIEIAPLGVSTGHFDGTWNGSTLVLAVSDEFRELASVNIHRVDGAGNVSLPVAVSGNRNGGFVATTPSTHGSVVVSWQRLVNKPSQNLAAQRVNRRDTLGASRFSRR